MVVTDFWAAVIFITGYCSVVALAITAVLRAFRQAPISKSVNTAPTDDRASAIASELIKQKQEFDAALQHQAQLHATRVQQLLQDACDNLQAGVVAEAQRASALEVERQQRTVEARAATELQLSAQKTELEAARQSEVNNLQIQLTQMVHAKDKLIYETTASAAAETTALLARQKIEIEQALADQALVFAAELENKLDLCRKQTRAVNFGNHAQHSIIPLMAAAASGISTKEITWLGNTMDFLCFKGLEDEQAPVELVFADAKTVPSVLKFKDNADKILKQRQFNPALTVLNKRQQRVFDAITSNRVSLQIWLTDTTGDFASVSYGHGRAPIYMW